MSMQRARHGKAVVQQLRYDCELDFKRLSAWSTNARDGVAPLPALEERLVA